MKIVRYISLIILVATSIFAQVAPPKHESHLHHLFAPHRDLENLPERFNDLKCALVLIESGNSLGTGFFISPGGDVATASHVVGDRLFSLAPNGVNVTLTSPPSLFLTLSTGERIEIPRSNVEVNGDAWLADVATIKTGRATSCWLREGDDRKINPGEHLITMGFPGLSFKVLTVYTGIRSARMTSSLPTIILNTGQVVQSPVDEFVRVQMPVSPGLSGAPVIDDENRVIAVLAMAGGWTQDLQNLMALQRTGAFQMPPSPPGSQPQPGMTPLNGFAVLAQLASLFHDYASPGYGDAVPLRYLRQQKQRNQPSSPPAH